MPKQEHCARCLKETAITTMSYFNTDVICMKCKDIEKQHPMYDEAVRADVLAIKRGDFNFPGIGKPSDL